MAEYAQTEERVILLASAMVEDPPEETGKRIRARQACASSTGIFHWMRIDVCAARAGGKLPADLARSIRDSADAVRLFRTFLGTGHIELKEVFGVVALDGKNAPLGFYVPGIGGVASAPVPVLEVFKPAVLLPAAAIIICHNHPSGRPEPSQDDIELTKRLCEISKILGVAILDHIILTADASLSFKDAGLWPC